MLNEIARVLVWLGIGEVLARLGLLPIPGPVIGLVLLYVSIAVQGRMPDELGALADRVLQILGMLFVPAGVGVVAHLDLLRTEWLPVLGGVIGGTAVTVLVTAAVAERFGALAARRKPAEAQPEGEAGDARA